MLTSLIGLAATRGGRASSALVLGAAAWAALTAGVQAQAPTCDSALAASVPLRQLIAACTAVIERDPNQAIAYFHRGNLHRRGADMERARADLDQAIRLDPSYAPAFVVRGLATFDHSRRLTDFSQAITLDPKYARAYLYRGEQYRRGSNYARAIADLDQAIALDPKLTEALQRRAEVYRESGDADRAIRDYDALIRLSPKADDAFYGRALAHLAKGDAAHAVADTGETIAIEPSHMNAYWLRGRLRFATGDFAGAAADLRHMLDDGALDSRPLVWLAAARGHARTDAGGELAATADKLKTKDWPYPLVEFLLGRRSIDQVMTAAATPEQRCDAAFHIGQWRIARDERESAIAYMKAAARDCEKGGVEALVAAAELKRLGQ